MNSINIKKLKGINNPIIAQRFLADPYAMYYDGKVYVYGSNDSDSLIQDPDGSYPKNQYGNMKSINCVSSSDLINWSDEGEIQVADDVKKGKKGAAAWAGNSWAPAVCYNTVDGKTKFFLYFANSAANIGVLSADSPTGPWIDPIGKPIISRDMPGCEGVAWLFDPAVLVDDDGSAYIYFGGGVPEGKAEHPLTARVAKLAPDMVSLEGEPKLIDAPYLFEDSGINKINGKYYYSYCTNWSEEADKAMGKAQISYMVSDNPMGPFEYKGEVMKNPGQSEYHSPEAWGNNHHCMHQIEDTLYMFYHSPQHEIDSQINFNNKAEGGCAYRTTYVDVVDVHEDGSLNVPYMTKTGTAKAIRNYNPYEANDAFVWADGVTTDTVSNEEVKPHIVFNTNKGYIGISGVGIEKEDNELVLNIISNKSAGIFSLYKDDITEANLVATVDVPEVSDGVKSFTCKCSSIADKTTDLFIEYTSLNDDVELMLLDWKFK